LPFTNAHPALQRTLAARNYTEPTPVQAQVLDAPADRDLLVSAQTGSGKTVAFGLALAPRLLGTSDRFDKPGAPRALIVAPTRELALQVHRELAWLYADTGARLTTCVGGMDPRRESYALAQGVHIVIGTPGRLCDHLERGALSLARIEAVVLDEADEMLDMGFREDLERLLDATPSERRTLMFSATIPKGIAALAKRYQRGALRLAATGDDGGRHHDIEYIAVPIVQRERDLAVVNLLRYHDAPGALVFCQTRDGVTHLAANLAERGFSVAALSGELSQRERNSALQALRDGRARVCVATDVAARGLDLPDLGLVIHADLPQNQPTLVHRSGRTGRAGKHGVAILIVPDKARRFVERLLHGARIDATWRPPPSADDIRARDQQLLVIELRALAASEEVTPDDLAVAEQLIGERTPEALVAALVRLRRNAYPAPEELTPVWAPTPGRAPTKFARDGRDAGGASGSRNTRDARQFRESRDDRFERYAREAHEGGATRGAPARGGDARDGDVRDGDARDARRAGSAHEMRQTRMRNADANLGDPRDAASAHAMRQARMRDADANDDSSAAERPAPDVRPARGQREERSSATQRDERPARGQPAGGAAGGGRWFTVNVGRSKNADPKWLIPLLCRKGGITKRAIGKIQVLMRETRVEIAADKADEFAEAIRRPDDKDRNIYIEPLDER
jgi:ATP-dependent RNA helicase DeaD